MSYVLALDQGTTSSRALLFDRSGRVRGLAQRQFTQHFPNQGWVEHDAMEILRTQLDCASRVLAENGVGAGELAAVGITNQRETTVLWERASGLPLAPAIVWQDRRTADRCDALRAAGLAPRLRELTGLEIDPYFSATKIEWLLDHVPGARQRAERGELACGTVDCWLAWQLTGRHVTDPSNASRTLLFDIARRDWSDELLDLFRVPRPLLPEIVASSGVVADVDARWLGAAVPLAGIVGDQQAATFGQACLAPGLVKNTYGTGCFMLMNTGATAVPSANRLLTTIGWQIGERVDYLLEGSVFMAGAIVQWLRDGLGLIADSAEVEALAASVPDTGGVVLVPAFAGLGAPHWDAHARAALFGLTRGSGRAEIARAALEAIACQCVDVFAAMGRDAGRHIDELHVDGGAARNDLLMQMQADLLDRPVIRPRLTETTAFGAAALAGLAVGFWDDSDEIVSLWQAERRFEPSIGADERSARLGLWQRGVERTLGWAG